MIIVAIFIIGIGDDGVHDHVAYGAIASGDLHRCAGQRHERVHKIRIHFAEHPRMHRAHRRPHRETEVFHSQVFGEQLVIRLHHIVVAIFRKMRAHPVAGLGGSAVADSVRHDDEIFRRVNRLPFAEEFTAEASRIEGLTRAASAVHDDDGFGGRRIADGVVMQLQLGQRFTVVKMKIVDDVIPFDRFRIIGSAAGQREYEKSGGFLHKSDYGRKRRSDRMRTMIAKVRKAVFPAAGLGTRFLPATKAQPKEMLPLVDKPLIQYGVEEAIQSGVRNIIIVTGRGKTAIEDHFDVSFELEHLLETRHKKELLATVRAVSDMINVAYTRQKEALGLGHAVLRARELVGDEPFSVILSDDVIDAEVPCLRQLLDVYEFYGASVVALMEVPKENISAYGVVDAEPVAHNGGRDRLYRIRNLVEKPKASEAPSNLAIIGRYVLTPDIFSSLDAIEAGSGGEIQLTDGLKHMLRNRPIYGYRFEGNRYDAGDKLGFLKATVEFALKRYDLGEEFRAYLKTLTL
jgi:UTP--glucose-1-phosphate uridylyltransferase